MNFASNIRPDFSVPPPSINPPMNHGNRGMGPRPTTASQNQFQQFHTARPVPPYNPNPQFPPYHFTQTLQTSRPNFHGNPAYNPRGNNFHPAMNNYNNCNGHRPPPAHHMPSHGQMFGTVNANNINNQTYPQASPHQQQNQIFQQTQPQPGRGRNDFHPGRGAFNRGGGSRPGGRHSHDRNFKQQNGNNKNHGQGANGQPKKKKERVDKRDLPENNAFFCDSCDRGFKTEDKYKEHVDGHVKCSHKDCPYTAAPKLVQLHLSMQHRGGLAKKIWSMESEEDVKKWRDDRKRNYPTAANIQKKKELREERLKRGEVLETKSFSKMKPGGNRDSGRGRGRQNGRFNRGHRNRRHGRFQHETQEDKKGEDDDEDDDDGPPEVKKICRSSCLDNAGTVSGDQHPKDDTIEPSDASENGRVGTQEQGHVSGLSLLTGYGSSCSDDEVSDQEQESTKVLAKEIDPLQLTSGSQKDKAVSPEKSVLCQPFTHDKGAESRSQEQEPSARAARSSSPQSCDSSGNSPLAYHTDPFNLTGGDQGDSVTSDDSTNEKCGSFSQNLRKELVSDCSVDKADCPQKDKDDFHNDFPIDDGEIFPEIEQSHDKTKLGFSSDSLGSDGKLNRRIERQPERFRSATGAEGQDKEVRRGELDMRRRRRQEHRPQAKSYTLLEKLLAPQIRQERNKVLQCIYYIVKHKFFQ